MRRRDFIRAISGAVAAWPIAARAQQPERVRRIGVLMSGVAEDPESKDRIAAFQQALRESGWAEGRNVRLDYRWGAGGADRIRSNATELVALAPDVILVDTSAAVTPLLQATWRSDRARNPIGYSTSRADHQIGDRS
jgi:putative tryptophan/tyrosine transport system substrate-binding protein